ncbi:MULTISPECIES: hypothetical protein [Bacillus]|uniref:hypothetical protein n=1 Tax=Bacillus TaxID=1386 RepID=UPI0008641A0E|nr:MULTISPECIES: hypothetical protein [Bacillus]MCP1282079.1 hypothetical protein [Bacillus sp. S0635]MCQ6346347.1 hypothetical protein [Bacillus cereus]MCU5462229.1 hypothetical protein [Bacillus cereus]MCU5751340.1 hypothetical protein [Bacillus cereus]SCM98815.1 Protein of unknown function [Bacillus cereus]
MFNNKYAHDNPEWLSENGDISELNVKEKTLRIVGTEIQPKQLIVNIPILKIGTNKSGESVSFYFT